MLVLDGEAIDEGEDLGEVLFVGLCGDEEFVHHVDELDVGERSVVDDGAVGWEDMSAARPGNRDESTHQRKNEQYRLRRRERSRTDRGSCP